MKHKRSIALILAVALLLGCGGYVPAVAVEPVQEEAAQQAGSTTVTASITDLNGSTEVRNCKIYVTIPDGVYYIQNASSGLCLANAESEESTASTHITAKNTSTETKASEFWKINYSDNGYYVIRPLSRLLSVLTVDSSGHVIVEDHAPNSFVAYADCWTIQRDASGLVFRSNGLASATMKPASASTDGSNVTTGTASSSLTCHWTLGGAKGVILRNMETQRAIGPNDDAMTVDMTIDVYNGDSLADIGLGYEAYGFAIMTSTVSSSNTSVIDVDNTTATIDVLAAGVTTLTQFTNIDGTTYHASVDLKMVLLRSGYELEYNEELWNEFSVLNNANCYGYALNIQVKPGTNELWNSPQPGQAAGNVLPDSAASTVITHVELDSAVLNFTFEAIEKYAKCDPGCYKVALVIANGTDFHWYRQNTDGTWSHKFVERQASREDGAGQVIYDPEYANHDYSNDGGANYDDYIAFFQVSPVNLMYDANATQSISTPDAEPIKLEGA